MTDVNYIRQEVNLKGRPYSEVADQMGRDFRTIKKYADQEDWNEPKQVQRRIIIFFWKTSPIELLLIADTMGGVFSFLQDS